MRPRCTECRADILPDSQFCTACGHDQAGTQCSYCGTRTSSDDIFCGGCGRSQPTSVASPSAAASIRPIQIVLGVVAVIGALAAAVYLTNQGSSPPQSSGEAESSTFEEIASELSSSGDGTAAEQSSSEVGIIFGSVRVVGSSLPPLETGASDPAIGLPAPTVSGEDWNGNQHTIGPDGRAKIVVMLAHWCPHCQREVPVIQNWVDSGGLPEGVDLYGTTVLTNRVRDGDTWPPHEWLESKGWTSPTIMDDQDGSIVDAYGMTGTPTYAVLGPNNENLGRISGEIGVDGLNALADIASKSLEGR